MSGDGPLAVGVLEERAVRFPGLSAGQIAVRAVLAGADGQRARVEFLIHPGLLRTVRAVQAKDARLWEMLVGDKITLAEARKRLTAKAFPAHPAADLFPMMGADGLAALRADIAERGVLEPVWVHRDGSLIDGRNRTAACVELGVDCPSQTFDGPDDAILDFVISHNLHRRHLNESQRAMVAARIATLKKGLNARYAEDGLIKPSSQDEAAERLNVSRDMVKKARKVLYSKNKALVQAVTDGVKSVSAAVKELAVPRTSRASSPPEEPTTEAAAAPAVPRLVHDADDALCSQLVHLIDRLREVDEQAQAERLFPKFTAPQRVNLDRSLDAATAFLVSLRNCHAAARTKENAADGAAASVPNRGAVND